MQQYYRVGVVGAGKMGLSMVQRLRECGFPVVAHDRDQAAVARAEDAGARSVGSLAALAEASDLILLSLPDSPAVEAVMRGASGGLCAANLAGKVILDTSTIRVETALACAAAASAAGGAYLDGPVTGGTSGARKGTLIFFVGGEADAVAQARPVLSALGQKATHVGPNGDGALVKLLFQIVGSARVVAAAEAFAIAQARHLDIALLIDSLGEAHPIADVAARARDGRWGDEGYLAQRGKDVDYALTAAREAGLDLPVTAAMKAQFDAGCQADLGSRDPQALTLIQKGAQTASDAH